MRANSRIRVLVPIMTALVGVFTASAQSGLQPPRLGWMLDAGGAVRPVLGVDRNTTLGDPVAGGVLALSCTEKLCLMKTATSIVSSAGAETAAPEGPALIAIDGASAYVYFSQSRQLARWHDGQLDPIDVTWSEDADSLRVARDGLDVAFRRDGVIWVAHFSMEDGSFALLSSLPPETVAVMLIPNGILLATADELILRLHHRDDVHFAIQNVGNFSPLGPGYIQAHAANLNYAIRVEPDHETAFLLPGAPPQGGNP